MARQKISLNTDGNLLGIFLGLRYKGWDIRKKINLLDMEQMHAHSKCVFIEKKQ